MAAVMTSSIRLRVVVVAVLMMIVHFRSTDAALSQCPHRCLCFATTVRCMFLQLDGVPEMPPETTTLDLRFNRIRTVPANAFRNVPKLNTLLLNNNDLEFIEADTFRGLSELQYLYLYKNRIRTIEGRAFQGLDNLQQLYLHSNVLEELEPGTFANLPSLERLFLYNNKLTTVRAAAFQNTTSLRRLRLDSNPLFCDCHILALVDVLKDSEITGTCNGPESVRSRSVMDVIDAIAQCKIPVLMEEPNDADVSTSGTVYFRCKADGQPQPEIFWLYNENKLDLTGRYNVLTDGTLRIEHAQDTEQGYFQCMAQNPVGEVMSRKAKIRRHVTHQDSLTSDQGANNLVQHAKIKTPKHDTSAYHQNWTVPVVSKRPKFIVKPTDVLVQRGSVVLLRCQAIGDPEPVILWTKNDDPIVDTERIQTSSYGVLTIDDSQTRDSGQYRCIASNHRGKVSASAHVTVQAPPSFSEEPKDQIVELGEDAWFTCRADGDPQPNILWYRKGRVLSTDDRISISNDGTQVHIRDVKTNDETTYLCRAQNAAGTRDAGADLMLRSKALPWFVERPQNTTAARGDTVQLTCSASGQPKPEIWWFKDGQSVRLGGRLTVGEHGTLNIQSVDIDDQGSYECRASNDVGTVSATAFVSVPHESTSGRDVLTDDDIKKAVDEARQHVNSAINDTLTQLFDPNRKHTKPSDLLRLVRFPRPHVQNVVRAAEIYEQAILTARHYSASRQHANLSNEYDHVNLLSAEHVRLMADLSGCLIHRNVPDCSDICFLSRFRSYNGSCNNLHRSLWGASEVALRRFLPPNYENGFNTPIGWTENLKYNGHVLPSARLISTTIVRTQNITPDSVYTHMLMQWGQFIDHDMDLSPPTVSTASFVDGTDCKATCRNGPPCFPIQIPDDDHRIQTARCMEFVRSSAVCGSGTTSILFGTVAQREQLNVLTSFLDASQVYGSSEAEAVHLRQKGPEARGLLRVGILSESGKPLLPFEDTWPTDCRRDHREGGVGCFLAGEFRVNEQLALTAMHTVWFREHNRLALIFSDLNRHWDSDRIYHETRKVLGAFMQHVTYVHWLPHIVGPSGMKMLEPFRGYNPDIEPTISNEFSTAAFRFGHTLINPVLHRLDANFEPIPQGHVHLRNAFFSPFRILEEGGIDPLLRGLFAVPAKLKRPSEMLTSELTEQLFRQVNKIALDLGAINIQRSRDHGLQPYVEYRKLCNLSVPETFDDLKHDIKDSELRDKLRKVYGHPGNIDLWVGGICEDVVPGGKVGPTFQCILVDQFRRLRDGDRYFYENPGVFRPEQLEQIKKFSLARLLCDNGDDIDQVGLDVFVIPESQKSTFAKCEAVPREDFRPWIECCQSGTCWNHIPTTVSRPRRHLTEFHSYPEEKPPSVNQTKPKQEHEGMSDVDENRFEGIEDIVNRLERTVRRLSKKLRQLERNCRDRSDPNCVDRHGTKRTDGESWTEDQCSECLCSDSQITCKVPSTCS